LPLEALLIISGRAVLAVGDNMVAERQTELTLFVILYITGGTLPGAKKKLLR